MEKYGIIKIEFCIEYIVYSIEFWPSFANIDDTNQTIPESREVETANTYDSHKILILGS